MTAEAYARLLKALLPPSKIWRLDEFIASIFLANGDELARVDARGQTLLREIDPATSDELLPDFERMLAITADGTLGERRAMVIARLLRRQRFRPADFQQVLAPLLDLAPEDVVVIETSHADAVEMDDDREIYRFWIYRDPGLAGTPDIAGAQEMLDLMKPSHTLGTVIESLPPETPMVTYTVSFVDAQLVTPLGSSWELAAGAGPHHIGIQCTNASAYSAVRSPTIPRGRTATAARVRVSSGGAAEVGARLVRTNADGSSTSWSWVQSVGASVETLELTGAALLVATGCSLHLEVQATGTGNVVLSGEVDCT